MKDLTYQANPIYLQIREVCGNTAHNLDLDNEPYCWSCANMVRIFDACLTADRAMRSLEKEYWRGKSDGAQELSDRLAEAHAERTA